MKKMMVTVYRLEDGGHDKVLGHILWDGQSLSADPPQEPTLQMILKQDVLAKVDGRLRPIPPTEGENFLRGLCQQYKSYHLRVSPPEPVPDDLTAFALNHP